MTTSPSQALRERGPTLQHLTRQNRDASSRRQASLIAAGILLACLLLLLPLRSWGVEESQISRKSIDAIADGNIVETVTDLQQEPLTAKTDYLLQQANRIAYDEFSPRSKRKNSPSYFRRLGIAYHNLFLYLQGI